MRRVDTAIAKHLRVNHPGTENLEPAGLAAPAAFAPAEPAGNGRANTRLGEGEMITRNPDSAVGAEQGAREILDRSLQVREPNIVVNHEAFELIELRSVRGISRIPPVDSTWSDDPDRRLVALHVSNLYRRGVRTQQPSLTLDVETVHRVACRMLRRDVERLEVVELVLQLWSQSDLVAKPGKDRLHLAEDQGQRMQVPAADGSGDNRDVDPFAVAERLEPGRLELASAFREQRFNFGFEGVGAGTGGSSLLGGKGSNTTEGGSQAPLLP